MQLNAPTVRPQSLIFSIYPLIMRYFKSTAFFLLAISSLASVLSREATAQIADETATSGTIEADEGAASSDESTELDLKSFLDSAQRSRPVSLLTSSSDLDSATTELATTEPATTEPAAKSSPNRLTLEDFRALATPPAPRFSRETPSPEVTAKTAKIVVEDRTGQIAQANDLPVLEESPSTPDAPTAAPSDPVPSDPGPADALPNIPLPNNQIEGGPDVVQPIPDNAPVEGAEPELGDLPDILFADPNPLNLPTAEQGVEIERNPVITLEQAIELAYRNSQALQTAILQAEQAAAAVREQQAARLPTVSVGATLESVEREGTGGFTNPFTGESSADVSGGTDTTLGGNITVDYDLLTGGSRGAAIEAAKLQLQVAEISVETQQEQLRLVTANNYYALQEAGENIRIQRSFLEEAERNLRDSRLRQEVGVGTRFDTLRAEVQYANARQQLIQSQGDQRIARRDIARLLNLPPNAGIQATPVAVADNWGLTLGESILLAYQNRGELEQQLLQADISEEQRKIALAAVRPRVSLFANYSAQDQLSDDGTSRGDFLDNYSFGARLNWLLFDGGAARASARQQEIGSLIAEEQFSEQSDQIRFDVEQAYFNLETNQENIATSRIAVSQAEEALSLANLRLQAGVGTQLDVLTAQSELTTAQGNNVTAILNYNRALAAMQRAVSNVTVE